MDQGYFVCLAEKLAETYKKVYYWSPYEQEYRTITRCVYGEGLERVERENEPLDPDFIKKVDLFAFPDIGLSGEQKLLRSLEKPVWGAMGASELELYRTHFIKTVQSLGLPVAKTVECHGLIELRDYLKTCKNTWIKIDCFRDDMETEHHEDYAHSKRLIEKLAVVFGPLQEQVWFVVQNSIEGAQEIGYDGYSIDGNYPDESFQGYEKKNKLYLGSLLKNEDMPDEVRMINEAFASVLRSYGYRNFWATEIRSTDEGAFFIDPTARMAGLTQEHLLETCTNLADVMWHGANGILIQPKFKARFAAEATLHYTSQVHDWKTIHIPREQRPYFKLCHYCMCDDAYHLPPSDSDELGVVLGWGDTVKESMTELKLHLDAIEDEPVIADLNTFGDLLRTIHTAEEYGMHFSSEPVPKSKDLEEILDT